MSSCIGPHSGHVKDGQTRQPLLRQITQDLLRYRPFLVSLFFSVCNILICFVCILKKREKKETFIPWNVRLFRNVAFWRNKNMYKKKPSTSFSKEENKRNRRYWNPWLISTTPSHFFSTPLCISPFRRELFFFSQRAPHQNNIRYFEL